MATSSPFVLSAVEQQQLRQLVRKGTASARQLTRARILQFTHQGHGAPAIRHLLGVSEATVYNVRRRYRDQGLAAALGEKPRPGQPRKVTPAVEATITSLACTEAPDGYARWSLRLLHARVIQLGVAVGEESVRQVLKKVNSSPGCRNSGV
ncbi:MAG: helix-turn-helix domain-containing protein [Hymenobacter sp.]|nr:MAG: helix-turn-helix domain-containing protein [Hymenobacter sp.]